MANTIQRLCPFAAGVSTIDLIAISGTASIQNTTVPFSKYYALQANPTLTGTGYGQIAGFGGTGAEANFGINGPVRISYAFRIGTLPLVSDEEFMRCVNGASTYKCALRINSSGNIVPYDFASAVPSGGTSSTALAANTNYRIDWLVDDSTSGTMEYRIWDNSGTLLETKTMTGVNMGATTIGRFFLGKAVNQNSNTVNFYYAQVWVDSAGYAPANYIIGVLMPASNGSNQGWSGGTGSSGYTEIDDIPASTADYVADPTSATAVTSDFGVQTFLAAGLSQPGTITGVQSVFQVSDGSSAVTNTMNCGIANNSGSSLNANRNTPANTNPEDDGRVDQTLPGSLAMNQYNVENLQLRVVENTASVTTRLYWAALYVGYVPNPAPPVSSAWAEPTSQPAQHYFKTKIEEA